MADGLSTGIGLSGKFDYSTTGLEPLVQAERDLMGRRVQEQQQKAKERQELEKEVGKMLVYDNQLKTPVYQKQLEDYATKGVSEIIEKMNNGDDDTRASAYKWLQNFKNFNAKISAADAEAQETFKAIAKDPNSYAWQDRQVIDGKEYGSLIEVLNDPKFADPEAMKSALQRFGGTDIQAVEGKTPSDPSMLVRWNPGQVADPIEVAIEDAKLRNQYDDYRVGKPFMFGDKRVAETAYGMNPNTVNAIVEESFMQKPVLRYYEELLYKNRPDKDMTRVEFSQTDWMSEAKRMHEQNVRPRIQSMIVPQGRIEDTLTAAKPSASLKAASEALPDGAFTTTGEQFTATFSGKAQKSNAIQIPKEAEYRTGGNATWKKVPAENTMEATPVRIEWKGIDKPSYIIYQSKLDPKGESMKNEEETYTYRLPFNRSTLAQAAGIYGTTAEELAERLISGAEGGPAEQIQKWYATLGGQGDVSGKPASAAPTGNKSKWESAKRK
jgi:hypothetical protein